MSDRCRHTLDLFDALTDDEVDRVPMRSPTLGECLAWDARLVAVGGACEFSTSALRMIARRGDVVAGRVFDTADPSFTVGEVERVVQALEHWARAQPCEDQ